MKNLFLKLINQQSIDVEEYEFYINVAVKMIERYLNIDEHAYVNVESYYEEQVLLLASHVYGIHENFIASKQNVGIKQISSNGRSVTFMDALELASQVAIPDYIKQMLPKPKSTKVKVW